LIEGKLKGENNVNTFQLVYVTDSEFTVAYKYKGAAYDIVIAIP
jgi:hypothetical protein